MPVLTIVVLIAVSFHGSNFTAGGGFAPFGAHGIFAALPLGVVFALQGFEQAVQMGGEAKNPQRDMPRAVIGAVLIGTLIYLALEVAFIGALDSNNLTGGWANPIGEGDFGPYATIATSLGLGWLAVILYIDAFISPAGTGLIYVGTSARLSYALGHAGFVPKGVSKISSRGVPWTSVILAFVVGLICFLPFPSWQGLVGLVTSATVIMYGFAPITLVALRKSDPDRTRPYRLPAATPISVLAFIAANLIIYWTGWDVDWKLLVGLLVGYVIFAFSYVFKHPMEKPPLDSRALIWMLPWFAGLAVISLLGQYGDGMGVLPEWIDLLVVAVFSIAIFFLGVRVSLPPPASRRSSPRTLRRWRRTRSWPKARRRGVIASPIARRRHSARPAPAPGGRGRSTSPAAPGAVPPRRRSGPARGARPGRAGSRVTAARPSRRATRRAPRTVTRRRSSGRTGC